MSFSLLSVGIFVTTLELNQYPEMIAKPIESSIQDKGAAKETAEIVEIVKIVRIVKIVKIVKIVRNSRAWNCIKII